MEGAAETRRLRTEIERSLRGAFDPVDVLPRLARLLRLASPASEDGVFANLKLAELLVERDPWRAALYVRRALAHRPDDDRAWATLAFCQTLLGHYRYACSAYRKAIARAPSNPWYAHNLGHLMDVALGEPGRAAVWLRSAYHAKSDSSEIVASYVHALARGGDMAEARHVLEKARGRFDSRELDALWRWLDQGAPARRREPAPRGRRVTRTTAGATQLVEVLTHGMSHLPLDSRQRERALVLARDVLPLPPSTTTTKRRRRKRPSADVASLAAAVAYAIVYIDRVPLSQAEVAAPFRVAVAHLRGRFAELRAQLDIIRGDARF